VWRAAQEAIREVEPHPNQPPLQARPQSVAHLEITPSSAIEEGLKMDAMRREIEQVDAANVPLPLQAGDGLSESANPVKGKDKGKERANPLGPL
jgi:hypothetical protein